MKFFLGHLFFLILIILGNEFFHYDLWLQKFFLLSGGWAIDKEYMPLKIFFYIGIKWTIILAGIVTLGLFIASFKNQKLKPYKKDFLLLVLAMSIIPSFISFLKLHTHMHCPYEIDLFGGPYPYLSLFEATPTGIPWGRCFPAGHASGGFALLALYFTKLVSKKNALFIGLGLGWIMGIYQMLKGDHFLSHSLVTQEISFLFSFIFYKILSNSTIFKE